MRSEHHASDRALTALDNASSSSTAAQESLQSVVNSLWPLPSETDLPTLDPSTLPQCAALYSQLCIAFVGAPCCGAADQYLCLGCMQEVAYPP